MKLAPDIAEAVVKAAGRELAERIAPAVEDLQLFTISQVAARLQVSEPTARNLVKEYVELGEASKRVTPATLRKLIEDRKISV
jgi:transposase